MADNACIHWVGKVGIAVQVPGRKIVTLFPVRPIVLPKPEILAIVFMLIVIFIVVFRLRFRATDA